VRIKLDETYQGKHGSYPLPMECDCLNSVEREAGLPAPGFRQEGGEFVQTLWRPEPAEATSYETGQVTGEVTAQVTGEVTECPYPL
jgi:hypothetical protein